MSTFTAGGRSTFASGASASSPGGLRLAAKSVFDAGAGLASSVANTLAGVRGRQKAIAQLDVEQLPYLQHRRASAVSEAIEGGSTEAWAAVVAHSDSQSESSEAARTPVMSLDGSSADYSDGCPVAPLGEMPRSVARTRSAPSHFVSIPGSTPEDVPMVEELRPEEIAGCVDLRGESNARGRAAGLRSASSQPVAAFWDDSVESALPVLENSSSSTSQPPGTAPSGAVRKSALKAVGSSEGAERRSRGGARFLDAPHNSVRRRAATVGGSDAMEDSAASARRSTDSEPLRGAGEGSAGRRGMLRFTSALRSSLLPARAMPASTSLSVHGRTPKTFEQNAAAIRAAVVVMFPPRRARILRVLSEVLDDHAYLLATRCAPPLVYPRGRAPAIEVPNIPAPPSPNTVALSPTPIHIM